MSRDLERMRMINYNTRPCDRFGWPCYMSYMDHQRSVSSVSLSTERTEGGVTTETVLGPDGGVNGAIVSASSSGLLVTLM